MRGESCIIFYCSSSKDAAGIPALLMTIRINNVKKSTSKVLREVSPSRGNILFMDKGGNVFV